MRLESRSFLLGQAFHHQDYEKANETKEAFLCLINFGLAQSRRPKSGE